MKEKRFYYDADFYRTNQTGSIQSAEATLPWLLEFIPCRSAVDIGCGIGTWLSVLRQNGVDDVIGIDGSYVDTQQLKIPPHLFLPHELEKPVCLDRTFDLALSLEVAEHLTPERAASFVKDLTQLAPIIVFSAAIPNQNGTNHLNEQWPAYWAELFKEQDYIAFDYIRPQLWDNEHVEYWYAQNMILYVQAERVSKDERLRSHIQTSMCSPRALVHPSLYGAQVYANHNPGLRKCIRDIPKAAIQSARRKIAK